MHQVLSGQTHVWVLLQQALDRLAALQLSPRPRHHVVGQIQEDRVVVVWRLRQDHLDDVLLLVPVERQSPAQPARHPLPPHLQQVEDDTQ